MLQKHAQQPASPLLLLPPSTPPPPPVRYSCVFFSVRRQETSIVSERCRSSYQFFVGFRPSHSSSNSGCSWLRWSVRLLLGQLDRRLCCRSSGERKTRAVRLKAQKQSSKPTLNNTAGGAARRAEQNSPPQGEKGGARERTSMWPANTMQTAEIRCVSVSFRQARSCLGPVCCLSLCRHSPRILSPVRPTWTLPISKLLFISANTCD